MTDTATRDYLAALGAALDTLAPDTFGRPRLEDLGGGCRGWVVYVTDGSGAHIVITEEETSDAPTPPDADSLALYGWDVGLYVPSDPADDTLAGYAPDGYWTTMPRPAHDLAAQIVALLSEQPQA